MTRQLIQTSIELHRRVYVLRLFTNFDRTTSTLNGKFRIRLIQTGTKFSRGRVDIVDLTWICIEGKLCRQKLIDRQHGLRPHLRTICDKTGERCPSFVDIGCHVISRLIDDVSNSKNNNVVNVIKANTTDARAPESIGSEAERLTIQCIYRYTHCMQPIK